MQSAYVESAAAVSWSAVRQRQGIHGMSRQRGGACAPQSAGRRASGWALFVALSQVTTGRHRGRVHGWGGGRAPGRGRRSPARRPARTATCSSATGPRCSSCARRARAPPSRPRPRAGCAAPRPSGTARARARGRARQTAPGVASGSGPAWCERRRCADWEACRSARARWRTCGLPASCQTAVHNRNLLGLHCMCVQGSHMVRVTMSH
jgi:hypothetical protein